MVGLLRPMKCFASILLFGRKPEPFAAEFSPFDGSKPIAVLIQADPWAMVMGGDNPRVAVYEDGTVFFLKSPGRAPSITGRFVGD